MSVSTARDIEGLVKDTYDLFNKLKKKIVAQRDPAIRELADVLGKLGDLLESVDKEVVEYLKLWFDKNDPQQRAEKRAVLDELEVGKVMNRLEKDRFHCSRIRQIYGNYLDKWFQRVFEPNDYKKASELFQNLSDCDSNLMYYLNKLAGDLENKAKAIQDLLDMKKFDEANRKIEEDRQSFRSTRNELSKTIQGLYRLRDEFIYAEI